MGQRAARAVSLTWTRLPPMPVLPITGRARRCVRHSERASHSPRVIHGKDTVVTAADALHCIVLPQLHCHPFPGFGAMHMLATLRWGTRGTMYVLATLRWGT